MSFGNILAGLFIGTGLAAAGYFVSQTTLNERTGANTAFVKGLSERIVPADTGNWHLRTVYATRDFADIAGSFTIAEANNAKVLALLTEAGFTAQEISVSPLRKTDTTLRDNTQRVTDRFYTLNSDIRISTQSPERIEPARAPIFRLAADGIRVDEFSVNYLFTGLNDIKPDMLREATENARIAANEFAQNAGVTVGGIQSASQGGFGIEPSGTGLLDKRVRVVTNITFYLEN